MILWDIGGLNVADGDGNITHLDITAGCFRIEFVYDQGTSAEYYTGVPLLNCSKCKGIVCDKCFKVVHIEGIKNI